MTQKNVVNEKNKEKRIDDVAIWIVGARIFCFGDRQNRQKKKRRKTSAQTQSRRARREIDDMSTDTDTQRVTHNTLDVT